MKCSLGISNFLEEIASLPHSIVFLYVFDDFRCHMWHLKKKGTNEFIYKTERDSQT